MSDSNNQGSGLQENVASLLCYAFGFISGIIFLFIDKDRPTVRFHAWQSILVFGAFFVLTLINSIVIANIVAAVAGIIGLVLMIAQLVAWVFLMFKAYQGEQFKVPMLGDIAQSKANG